MMIARALLLSILAIAAAAKPSRAAGGISHVYMAHRAAENVFDSKLQNLLKSQDNAYSVGACYADSGYVSGASYGELSHWDAFIFAFAEHLKSIYRHPIDDAPKQVAFLMGCVNHRVSDEIFHWVFLHDVAEHDFHGDWNAAHSFGDLGLDIIVTVEQNLWFTHASHWYVPVTDLVATYKDLGHTVSRKEIISSNALYYFAGLGERLMAPVTYARYIKRAPWAAKHYLDDPKGGYHTTSAASARYMEKLWIYLQDPQAKRPEIPFYSWHVHNEPMPASTPSPHLDAPPAPFNVQVHQEPDGSVDIMPPNLTNPRAYLNLLDGIAHASTVQ